MDMIKIKRGLKQNLPSRLPLGEPAYCTDTYELFIGMGDSQPPKAIRDPRFSDSFGNDVLSSVAKIEERTGDLEISRDELNRICGELTTEMTSIKNDLFNKTYTELITQDLPVVSVPNNVVSGGFSDTLIKGKTLVNLATMQSKATNGSTINTHYSTHKLNYINSLKANTPYTVFFRVNKKTDNQNWFTSTCLTIDDSYGFPSMSENLPIGHSYFKQVITLDDDMINGTYGRYLCLRPVSGRTLEVPSGAETTYDYNIVIVEGDYSHLDLDYFEGVCSVTNPYILNTNGNMFPKTMYTQPMTFENSNNAKLIAYARVQKGVDYRVTFQYQKSISMGNHGGVALVLTNCVPLDTITSWYINESSPGIERVLSLEERVDYSMDYSFQPRDKEQYVAIYVGQATSSDYNYTATIKGLYLGKTSDVFVTPKYNKTPSTNIVLRSLPDGTCDTYNPITGEYVKHIGETTYNGSEYWVLADESNAYYAKAYVSRPTNAKQYTANLYCNLLTPNEFLQPSGNHVYIRYNLDISLDTTMIGGSDLNAIKKWMKDNPITLVYPLETPIVEYVYGVVPQVYENGYIQVGSDSITPTVEYQLPTSIGSKLDEITSSVAHIQNYLSSNEESGTFSLYEVSGCKLLRSECFYNRVGKQVFICVFFEVSMGTSGIIELGGLPFVSYKNYSCFTNGTFNNLTFDSSTIDITPLVVGTHISFLCNRNNNSDAYYLPYSCVSSNKNATFKISGTYFIE